VHRCWRWVSRRLPLRGRRPPKYTGATVSINGETKHQGPVSAFAQASSGPAPNVAVAVGSSSLDPSSAVVFAPGNGNKAIAIKALKAVQLS